MSSIRCRSAGTATVWVNKVSSSSIIGEVFDELVVAAIHPRLARDCNTGTTAASVPSSMQSMLEITTEKSSPPVWVTISATKSAGVGNVSGRNTRTAFVGWTYWATACAIQADHIAATVASWLAELDAWTPLVGLLGRAVHDDDWPAIHAIADYLSVEVQVAT